MSNVNEDEIHDYVFDYSFNIVPEEVEKHQAIRDENGLPRISFSPRELMGFLEKYTVRWESRN